MYTNIKELSKYNNTKVIDLFLKIRVENKIKKITFFFKKITEDIKLEILFRTKNFEKTYIIREIENDSVNIKDDVDKIETGDLYIYFKILYGDIFILSNYRTPCFAIEYLKEKKINPLISIVTPTYNTNIENFKETYKSVISQDYVNWEWCIVDNGTSDNGFRKLLKSIEGPKIKVFLFSKNKGISEASNKAIELSRGDYIGFLDHDDILCSNTLTEIVNVIQENPSVEMIYTDEDKILNKNIYKDPFKKPNFDYTRLLTHMYIGHFLVLKKSIINKIGGLRKSFDGSQDYDLVLRVVEHIQPKNIYHIPKVLYHWRITSTSASLSILNKPYARLNGLRALEEHLHRMKFRAIVSGHRLPCHYNVKYILRRKPSVSIIIPFKDKINFLKNLLTTIKITDYPNYKILLINNNSTKKETFDYLKKLKLPNIKVIEYNKLFNFSELNNTIVNKYVYTELTLFMNNDIEIIHPEWLYNMVQYFVRKEVSIVGPKLLYLDHCIQHAGIVIGTGGIAQHILKYKNDWDLSSFARAHITQEVSAVTGACMLIRTKDFIKVKGFDENLPAAFNDIDLCLKIRSIGKKIVYTPNAVLYHHESATRGYDSLADIKFRRYIDYIKKKWDIDHYKDPYMGG